ncbi:MAG: tyrosine-type recombinase/integrase [Chloroflexi bacterium]|nr:tyrosine-type recombinase/integrase [Chloroflexota bacterium]
MLFVDSPAFVRRCSPSSRLRHTTASLLIDQGAELRDVMEQLGHSQIALTANTYGHIFLERKKKLAIAMGELLSPTAPTRG